MYASIVLGVSRDGQAIIWRHDAYLRHNVVHLLPLLPPSQHHLQLCVGDFCKACEGDTTKKYMRVRTWVLPFLSPDTAPPPFLSFMPDAFLFVFWA
jgi:hypothetical protein